MFILEAVASRIFKQILSGLNYLHLNGVCHRDLKPNNILVSKGILISIENYNESIRWKNCENC